MTKDKPDKLLDILKIGADYLKQNGIEDSRLNAELMLCEILNYDRINLYLNFERPLNAEEKEIFKSFLRRRIKREPLQYILGKSNFLGYNFLVNKDVLIPRPETEYLVELSLSVIKENELDKFNILEIGTGCGCISISLSRELDKLNKNYHIDAIDSSSKSIELALKNSQLNAVNSEKLSFLVIDILKDEMDFNKYDLIISNPPYIPYDEYEKLPEEIKLYEPANTLTDFEDGLKFYKRIMQLLSKWKNKIVCLFEIGYNQKSKLETLLKNHKIENYKFERDLNNHFRYLIINQ